MGEWSCRVVSFSGQYTSILMMALMEFVNIYVIVR